MNTFTIFALVLCAIFAMVSAGPNPMAPAEMAEAGQAAEAVPLDDMLEGAESRGYGYKRRGGGGGGGGHYNHGHDHYHHGHYGHGR